jgi:hypothetical protein
MFREVIHLTITVAGNSSKAFIDDNQISKQTTYSSFKLDDILSNLDLSGGGGSGGGDGGGGGGTNAAQIQSDWAQEDSTKKDFIKNKPVLFSGSFADLTDIPPIADSLDVDASDRPLSAKQGMILLSMIGDINGLLDTLNGEVI